MPVTDQIYYFAVGYTALVMDAMPIMLGFILLVLAVCFVLMLCRMARRTDDD